MEREVVEGADNSAGQTRSRHIAKRDKYHVTRLHTSVPGGCIRAARRLGSYFVGFNREKNVINFVL